MFNKHFVKSAVPRLREVTHYLVHHPFNLIPHPYNNSSDTIIIHRQTFNEWVRGVSGLDSGSGPKTQTYTQNIKKISDPNTPKKLGPDPKSDPSFS